MIFVTGAGFAIAFVETNPTLSATPSMSARILRGRMFFSFIGCSFLGRMRRIRLAVRLVDLTVRLIRLAVG